MDGQTATVSQPVPNRTEGKPLAALSFDDHPLVRNVCIGSWRGNSKHQDKWVRLEAGREPVAENGGAAVYILNDLTENQLHRAVMLALERHQALRE